MSAPSISINTEAESCSRRYSLRSASHEMKTSPRNSVADTDKSINGQRRCKSSSTTTAIMTAMMHRPPHGSSSSLNASVSGKRSKSESDSEAIDVEGARKIILQYSVDPYDYSHNELITLSVEIFRHYDLMNRFEFSENALRNFFLAVKDLYRANNDFHNFRHAWGVMHMVFQILLNGADEYLEDFDLLAVLVAAICHDVGHPGTNNAFELAINSDVSKKYAMPNEVCVLEKYHASETQSLLSKRSRRHSNLLVALSEEAKQRFFQQVKFIILGTDMAKHTALVSEAKDLVEKIIMTQEQAQQRNEGEDEGKANSDSLTGSEQDDEREFMRKRARKLLLEEEEEEEESSSEKSGVSLRRGAKPLPSLVPDSPLSDASAFSTKGARGARSARRAARRLLDPELRMALTRIIVHTSDIGAQTQQLEIASKWAERVYREFRSQAEKERALGIVTSPFIHQLQEDYMIYTSQASFIADIVEPIWKAMHCLLPQMGFAVAQLVANKKHYEAYGESLKAKAQQQDNSKTDSEVKTDSTAASLEDKEGEGQSGEEEEKEKEEEEVKTGNKVKSRQGLAQRKLLAKHHRV